MEDDKDDPMIDDDNEDKEPQAPLGTQEGSTKSQHEKKKKKSMGKGPQPHQYGSVVLDYLEAKYVRGVMLGDAQ